MTVENNSNDKQNTPAIRKLESRVLRIAGRIKTYADQIAHVDGEPGDELRTTFNKVDAGLRSIVSVLAELPDNALQKKHVAKKLSAGTKVAIREKARKGYEGFMDNADLAGLTVVEMRGMRVACDTASGIRILVPRGHVVLEEASA